MLSVSRNKEHYIKRVSGKYKPWPVLIFKRIFRLKHLHARINVWKYIQQDNINVVHFITFKKIICAE